MSVISQYKIIFVHFLLYLTMGAFGQSKQPNSIKPGLYLGGDFYENSITNGFYWFGGDSTFVMASFKADSSVYTIGTGKYYVSKNGLFTRDFKSMPALYFQSNKIEYLAETKGSTDTIYFSGVVTDDTGLPIKVATVSFPGIKAGVRSDTSGKYYIPIAANRSPQSVRFESVYGCPLDVNLINHFNHHIINVSLNRECLLGNYHSEKAYAIVEAQKIIRKLLPGTSNNLFRASGSVKFERVSDFNSQLINMLTIAQEKQPNLKLQLNWLIKHIR